MKPHLPLALLKSLRKALVLTFTIGTTGYLWAAPSYSNRTLTIDNGYNAAVRMGSGNVIYSRSTNRYDTSNRSRISYNNSSFSDGTRMSSNATIDTINIAGSGALYLYDRSTNGNDFDGTININGGTPGVIGTYNTSTAANLVIGTLTGSGELLLRGHNTSGTSSFAFTNNYFAGTVKMTANGGQVKVYADGEGWKDAVIDFEKK